MKKKIRKNQPTNQKQNKKIQKRYCIIIAAFVMGVAEKKESS
jgi:hypothetical protein